MTTDRIMSDVCVIGGGPSGSTVAHHLATLGHDVCLIEKYSSPRPHIAASLPPTVLPLLDFIGVRDRVETAGFLRPTRTIKWWSEVAPSVADQPGPPGFHVDRGEFDRLLLQNAAENGVRVLQPAVARQPARLNNGAWKIVVRHERKHIEVLSRFVVDGSGARNVLGGRRVRASASLLALYAEWNGVDILEIEGRVEAGDEEWFWYAPFGGKRSVAAVFVDPQRLSTIRGSNLESKYLQLLEHFRLFMKIRRGRIKSSVKTCDASSRYAEEPVGLGFVRIGDAAFTLDPLSSQGVQSAISSAIQAAIVVNTFAFSPENADAAIAFYRARQREKVQQHTQKTAYFYAQRAAVCDQQFWHQRSKLNGGNNSKPYREERLESDCRIQLSTMTRIESTPIIQEDIVVFNPAVNHEMLARPVAFVGGVELVPLLRQISSGDSVEAVVKIWSRSLSAGVGWKIMQWLWERRIVVPTRQ